MPYALTYDQLMALPAFQQYLTRGRFLRKFNKQQSAKQFKLAGDIYRAAKAGLGNQSKKAGVKA